MSDDAKRPDAAGRARPCGCPEYLTVADVCALLHVNHHKVEDWIYRPCDPMPFRCFPGSQRGSYIHRDDLEDWFRRNTILLRDERANRARAQAEEALDAGV